MAKPHTHGLFLETSLSGNGDLSNVRWTIQDQDKVWEGKTYVSLYRLYMETADPTEWEFVQQHYGSWEHWELLCSRGWFKETIKRWRKELELKLKAQALRRIQSLVLHPDAKLSFQVNKYLVQHGYTVEGQPKRGRPSKEEIKRAAAEQADLEKDILSDLERINSNGIQH